MGITPRSECAPSAQSEGWRPRRSRRDRFAINLRSHPPQPQKLPRCFFAVGVVAYAGMGKRPGPRLQPKKSAARPLIISLRKQNHSVYEISELLQEQKLPLSPTAVREVLKAEGFAALPRRRDEERPQRPRPTVEAVADVCALSLAPRQFFTGCGGLFLFLPHLAACRWRRWPRPPACPVRR